MFTIMLLYAYIDVFNLSLNFIHLSFINCGRMIKYLNSWEELKKYICPDIFYTKSSIDGKLLISERKNLVLIETHIGETYEKEYKEDNRMQPTGKYRLDPLARHNHK